MNPPDPSAALMHAFVRLLEAVVPTHVLRERRAKHPAARQWQLLQRLLQRGGRVRFEEDKDQLQTLCSAMLDATTLALISGGASAFELGSLDGYGDEAVQRKVRTRLRHHRQYPSVMLELSSAAWHMHRGHTVTPFEIGNYPDFKVIIPGNVLPVFVECKRLASQSPGAVTRNISDANDELRAIHEDAYKVAIIDISACVADADPLSTSGLLTTDLEPFVAAARSAVRGDKNRSVGKVILVWDESGIIRSPPVNTLIHAQRSVLTIDHEPVSGVTPVAESLPLFSGLTGLIRLESSATVYEAIAISPLAREGQRAFALSDEDLQAAFRGNVTWQQIQRFEEQTWFLALCGLMRSGHESEWVLCFGCGRGDTFYIHYLVLVPQRVLAGMDAPSPFEVLRELVRRYGVPVTVNNNAAPLFWDHAIELPAFTPYVPIIAFPMEGDHQYLALFQAFPIGPSNALPGPARLFAYCLDETRLSSDLR